MSIAHKPNSESGIEGDAFSHEKKWYVFYTAPRAEKVVLRDLSLQGYEVFLPKTKTLCIWKNRQKKMIDKILFPSYIFVKTEEKYLADICQIPKIATSIHCGGKPSTISFKCIEGIKRIIVLEQEITVEHNFSEGENVRIIFGPLAGYNGILIKQKSKKKFGLQLKEINQTMFIEICSNVLEKVSLLAPNQ